MDNDSKKKEIDQKIRKLQKQNSYLARKGGD